MARLPKVLSAEIQADPPSAGDLKNKFLPQSIPKSGDFAQLIDLANAAPVALGLSSPDGTAGSGPGKGLVMDSEKLAVNAGTGLSVGVDGKLNNTVTAQNVFAVGMIMMFSGPPTDVPEGWSICDGSNGTPNLVDRFILGASAASVERPTNYSSAEMSGVGQQKMFSGATQPTVTGLAVSNEMVSLSNDQLPEHFHLEGELYMATAGGAADAASFGSVAADPIGRIMGGNVNGTEFPLGSITDSTTYITHLKTSPLGGNGGHTHPATVTDTGHSHTIQIAAPYYLLAFIIRK